MFGIDYDPNAYIGTDLFSKDHRNLIIFVTHTWYDGKVFSPYSNPLKYDNYKENEGYASDMLIKNEVLLNYNYEDLK